VIYDLERDWLVERILKGGQTNDDSSDEEDQKNV
jgi:hypothetical protein